ncbi:hypothetical protein LX99_00431 [Mucilaginibacter oryzae]|uniref:Uncharacterized protein n=1 Tax=Mucilaginibacter oryzae TaxID=468058 RepID=A0A316HIX2_9SPHI|nr:hypothetical protein [Mucilaginibacter oryzae]PWK79970.1 hypothetical protein LX99_00431 [Mucilaginibacter oryzae]
MKPFFYKRRFIFIPLGVIACLAVISFVVMQLWNCLLPDILHVTTITYWQAMGIFVLCKILFGFGKGGPKGGGAPWMRGRMAERFKNMSPEEREQFRTQWEDRMCGWKGRGAGRFGHNWDDFGNGPVNEEKKAKE